ncbi:ThuA domain-containing protein [Virgibacillus sp. NKC19-3]|uniref:ThuA domain-containing protein n=1 Tax=Virgibacillus saliphilus TaxID=2831674 RepID=UPI001C9AA292|nr:ThuA domain-containing protein [Virgibacillus sp. NKC19-3]MBY7142808.1 ThuA domain-containing protein [Virgibacillus sp. NKC19-3]
MKTVKKVFLPLTALMVTLMISFTTFAETGETSNGNANETKKVLMVTATEVFRHASIDDAHEVMPQLADEHGFEIDITEDVVLLNADNLANYDVLAFVNTTGELPISDQQKEDILNFIESGNGFFGVHAATDTFYEWAEYGELTGAYFEEHPWTEEVTFNVEQGDHPSTEHLDSTYTQLEEVYLFQDNPRYNDKHILMSLNMDSVDGEAHEDHPTAWVDEIGKGRMFYTALGHHPETWYKEDFQQHLLGGLQYAWGDSDYDASEPTPEPNLDTKGMAKHVGDLKDDGEFDSDEAVHSLTLHLTAVSHYENQGEATKVNQHMEGFKDLLNHQLDNDLITEKAFDILTAQSDAVIQNWDE